VVSADTSGVLRVWPLPDAGTRAILRSPTRIIAAAFLSSEGPIIGTRASSSVALVGLDGSVKDLPGHVPTRTLSSRGPHGRFALYGRDEFIELWSLSGASSATMRLLKTDHDIVTAVRYLDGGGFVSSGRDGRLVEWAANGESHRELASIHVPITMTAAIPNSDAFVLFDAKGALWRVDRESRTLMDVSPYSVTTHAWSSDGRLLAVGTSQGVIQLHDLRKPGKRTLATFPSGIVALAFSATDDQIAAIAGRSVHIIDATEPHSEGTSSIATRIPWHELNLRPRGVAFSRDREWLALNCEDGMVWFYNIETRRWATLALSNANVLLGEFSDDSRRFLTTDSTGQATLVDMKSLLRTD
jgi:WD40 repeat protein